MKITIIGMTTLAPGLIYFGCEACAGIIFPKQNIWSEFESGKSNEDLYWYYLVVGIRVLKTVTTSGSVAPTVA